MKKYLVTGAAGFIGSAIAKDLVAKGSLVWTIDNLSTGYKENIPDGVEFVEGDCADDQVIKKLGREKFDAILHIAGQSSGEISFSDPVYDLKTNTESTLRLINYGLETGCKRFIYASSMSVYGVVPDEPIAESFFPKPLSFYGIGKLASEHYLRIYETKGIIPTALRYFNVYGANQNMRNLKQGMVSIFLAQLIREEKVIIKGAADRFRDFIFIDDIVNVTTGIIDDERTFGAVYNVGTGVRTTVGELLEKLKKISGIDKECVFSGGTPGDQKGIYADTSLLKELGFNYKYSIDEGLERMIQWAKTATW